MQEMLTDKEALHQSEEKFRAIFNAMDQGYCMMELIYDEREEKPVDLVYLEVNPAFVKQTGIDPIGKKVSELFGEIEPYWYEAYHRVLTTGVPERIEYQFHKLENNWFTVFITRLHGPGTKKVAALFEDISARKKAETVLQQAHERKTFLLTLSDALRPLADAVEIQEMATKLSMDYFNADRCYYSEIEKDIAIIRRDAHRPGLPSVAAEYDMKDMPLFKAVIERGSPLVVEDVNDNPFIDEALLSLCIPLQVISFIDIPVIKKLNTQGILCLVQGSPRQWTEFEIEIAQEIAERIWAAVARANAENALREQELAIREAQGLQIKENEEIIRRKDEFVGFASHELKTPLTSMMGYIEMLQEEYTDTEEEFLLSSLNIIERQVNRLLHQINDLLNLTKIDTHHFSINKQWFELDDMLIETMENVQAIAAQRINFSRNGKCNCYGDREKLEQVFSNLLSNAVKYAPGSSQINVVMDQQADHVKVSVQDFGIGISEENLGKVFERFYRVPGEVEDTFAGFGIGLYLAADIITQHEGTIWVESKKDQGSTFYFSIPMITHKA